MRGFVNNIPHRLQISISDIYIGFGQLTNLNERIVDVFVIESIGKERNYCVDGRHVEDS